MKKLILFAVFSFTVQGQTLDDCRNYASNYIDPVQHQDIPATCYDVFKQNMLISGENWSKDWTLYAFGAANTLYFEKYALDATTNTLTLTERSPIAGPNSFLKNVLAVEVVKDLNRAYLINKDGENYIISSYELMIGGGNLSPHTKLAGAKVERASNLKADLANNELYVISGEDAWIKAFNLKAHDESKQAEKENELHRKIQGTNTGILSPVDLDISSGTNEIFVLEDGNKVIVFDRLSDGDVLPKRSIEGESALMLNAKEIRLDEPSNTIIIVNGDDQELHFPMDAQGDVVPTQPE